MGEESLAASAGHGKRILILSSPNDGHTKDILRFLGEIGSSAFVFNTGNPLAQNRVEMTAHESSIRLFNGVETVDSEEIGAVWYRRPSKAGNALQLPGERAAAYMSEWDSAMHSALTILASNVQFWVNRPEFEHMAENKLDAFKAAEVCGFRRLHTLVTNDPDELLTFLLRHDGKAVVKQFYTTVTQDFKPQVQLVQINDLKHAAAIRALPGIYQEYVPTVLQLRVTVIGNHVAAGAIKPDPSVVDIRRQIREGRGVYSHYKVDELLKHQCINLRQMLNLAMVTFDIGIDNSGNFALFDINPSGNFISMEIADPDIKVARPFAEYLAYGRTDYEYRI